MPVTDSQVRASIDTALTPTHLVVTDVSNCGCGTKFEVLVVSDRFEGVALIERHRLVNASVKEEMSEIHALSMKTYTPAQWAKINTK